MKLLIGSDRNLVSGYPVAGFESAIRAAAGVESIQNRASLLGKALNRLLLSAYRNNQPRGRLLRIPFKRGQGYFSISVGPYFAKCLPHFLAVRSNSLYLMDAWPSQHDLIDFFISQLNIGIVFLSSEQATRAFSSRREDVRFLWLPEAINPQAYSSRPYAEKDIDVLQFGRKYDLYHERILGPLQDSARTYLYEKIKGELVFPTRDDFVSGLGRTRVSVCFPSRITHPARAGDVSTMTTRYLQSMAAKCLVVGATPLDMGSLFGYDPVIQANMDDPYGQLDDILTHFAEYLPLIERNYRMVWEHHTWQHRWEEVRRYVA